MNAPEFVFLVSDLIVEKRSTAIVVNRLCALGAVKCNDRRESPSLYVSHFNMDNNYCPGALGSTMRAIMGNEIPIVNPPADYKGEFFKSRYL